MPQQIVINSCFGGFGLSREAYSHIAKILGRPCYFFKSAGHGFEPDDGTTSFFTAISIENPNDNFRDDNWNGLSDEEKKAFNLRYSEACIPDFKGERSNSTLVDAVNTLGEAVNGPHARLTVVEVPDDVKWHIEEYDGSEHVAEDHRVWR